MYRSQIPQAHRLVLGPLGLAAIASLIVACTDALVNEDQSRASKSSATSGHVEMPRLVNGPEAIQNNVVYPREAIATGLEGRVIVDVLIGRDGEAKDPAILFGEHEALNEAAVEAVLESKFVPGTREGEAVDFRAAFPVDFRLPSSQVMPDPVLVVINLNFDGRRLEGRIVDAVSGTPVEGAEVSVRGTDGTVATAHSGIFGLTFDSTSPQEELGFTVTASGYPKLEVVYPIL